MNVLNTRFQELGLRGKPGTKHLKRLAKTQIKYADAHPHNAVPQRVALARHLSLAIIKRRHVPKKVTMVPGDHTGPKG